MKKTFLVFVLAALLLPSSLFGQAEAAKAKSPSRNAAENITSAQLKDYLYFVASDEMEGRDTPSRGLDTTAKFIATLLSRWGVTPAGEDGTYFQKIVLKRNAIDPATSFVQIGGEKYPYGVDYYRYPGSTVESVSGPLVYAGNGWVVKAKNINPFEGIDVKGKIVLLLGEGQGGRGTLIPMPSGITPDDLKGEKGVDWSDGVTYAKNHGAAAVVVLPSPAIAAGWGNLRQFLGRGGLRPEKLQPTGGMNVALPTYVISPHAAEAVFAGEAANPMSGPAKSFELSASKQFGITTITKAETLMTQNVVGLIEGSDPVLKKEMVAVGAHYDHVGTNPNAPGTDKIWNGADDDGSGTVSILSMAEALAKSPKKPKRSILFVWHCGEEKGLWGSEYFNKFPTVNIKDVTAQLNIDMIGRSRKPDDTNPKNKDLSGQNEVFVIGSVMMSSTLGSVVNGINSAYLKLDYNTKYDDPKDTNRFFFRSDHFNYALNGIPITFWFDGVHEDYHQPGDEPQKIDYPKMEKIARTIFLTMWELADLKQRPAVDKQLPPELSQR
jgi:hypothetical protein